MSHVSADTGKQGHLRKGVWGVTTTGLALAGLVYWFIITHNLLQHLPNPPATEADSAVHGHVHQPAILNLNNLDRDPVLQGIMKARKKALGVASGIDAVARLDEAIRIGNLTVTMREIVEGIELESGHIVESDLRGGPLDNNDQFGIYVVRPGDDIWNHHFMFLKDYLAHRGISIEPIADEPDRLGFSSGVGKILKFSEKIASIYDIREKKLDEDIHLIAPHSKLMIYRMKEICDLLGQIDDAKVDRIEFDGETLWIPPVE